MLHKHETSNITEILKQVLWPQIVHQYVSNYAL